MEHSEKEFPERLNQIKALSATLSLRYQNDDSFIEKTLKECFVLFQEYLKLYQSATDVGERHRAYVTLYYWYYEYRGLLKIEFDSESRDFEDLIQNLTARDHRQNPGEQATGLLI